jgi:glycosyltransferase involved in cell wall biosynthesis
MRASPQIAVRIADPAPRTSVAVVLISKGRSDILDDTIDSVLAQKLPPAQVLVVVPGEQDLPRRERGGTVRHIVGPLGICVQRNAAIDAIPAETDLVAFFDDDFELRPDYLEIGAAFLAANPDVVAFSGLLLANGGVTREEARQLVGPGPADGSKGDGNPADDGSMGGFTFQPKGKDYILHGCNMVIRRSILAHERFDEYLPLYAYGEDYELTMRLERHGRVGKFSGCIGVHLESPGGRVREVQRGYSFIANNWYFMRKGSIHLSPFMARVRFWLVCVGKTFAICAWNVIRREPSKDWAGRIRGLWLALTDIPRGRCDPRRILEL